MPFAFNLELEMSEVYVDTCALSQRRKNMRLFGAYGSLYLEQFTCMYLDKTINNETFDDAINTTFTAWP